MRRSILNDRTKGISLDTKVIPLDTPVGFDILSLAGDQWMVNLRKGRLDRYRKKFLTLSEKSFEE